VPIGQTIVHPVQASTRFGDPEVWVSLLALIASLAIAWMLRRRAPVVAFGWLWFLLGIAPSSLVPLNELMAEHRVYLGSIGFFLMLAAAAVELWRVTPAGARRLEALALAAMVVVLIGLTWRRAGVWSDEVLVWTEATQRAPETWASHFFLGEALRRRDGCSASLASYRRAIPLDPSNATAHLRIGVCLADGGDPKSARTEFEAALALDPTSTQALDYMGRIVGNEGHYDQARDYFERAVASNPDNVPALLDLARLHEVVLHQPAEALRLCREAMFRGEVRGQAEACVHRNEAALARGGQG
jgi:protein O-mannosyl-transferase